MEGGLSKIEKIDRARRNALKSGGMVLGAVVAIGVTKSASAATLPDWLCKIAPGLCSPLPVAVPAVAAIALRGAR